MDERLKKALDISNYRNSFELQKKTAHEKLDAKLTFGYNGGIFKIDSTLICFVNFLLENNRNSGVPIIDLNNNPILITDVKLFRDNILDRYFTGCNEYFNEINDLKKNRSIEKLVGYYD
jgi:hypothetical protein